MKRLFLLFGTLPLLLLLASCGGSEGPTGPTYPDIVGTYNGTWTMEVEIQSSGETGQIVCPGSITVASQTEGQFSGSYIMEGAGDCESPDSGTVEGAVRTDGGIGFSLSSPGGNPNEFSELTGCTVTSGDEQLSGTVASAQLNADATFFADCPDNDGQYFSTRWTLSFSG